MPEGYLCKDYQPLQTDQQEMELINRAIPAAHYPRKRSIASR